MNACDVRVWTGSVERSLDYQGIQESIITTFTR